jgi:NNP family nitrate/nitrite transporter-like MFS transporter
MLARAYGWQTVFGLALIPVLLMLVAFYLLAKDSPNQPAPRPLSDYGKVLGQADTWWFCMLYAVTFGGFVGMASFLNTFFTVQYELSKVQAGYFATACVIAGSFLRPVGGYLADRFGGVRMLLVLYTGVGLAMVALGGLTLLGSSIPTLVAASVVLFAGMGCLGMGNGAVFQLVPQRFSREIGVITGIVGAAGGIGGFFLPSLLGGMRQLTGSFTGGFLVFALAAGTCAGAVLYVARIWEGSFVGQGGVAAAAEATA